MRILLIEDDVSLCKALLIHLGSQGYETDVCHNGTDGLSYALQNTYDLIILDRMLPELDGMTLLGAIRKKNISTPVIMATAMDSLREKSADWTAAQMTILPNLLMRRNCLPVSAPLPDARPF